MKITPHLLLALSVASLCACHKIVTPPPPPAHPVTVYTCGSTSPSQYQVSYWKNDSIVPLPSMGGFGTSIALNGADVYVGGADGPIPYPAYWMNQNETVINFPPVQLQSLEEVEGIAVSNGDVYCAVSSYYGPMAPFMSPAGGITKNDSLLYTRTGIATGIALSGTDIYWSGYYQRVTDPNSGQVTLPVAVYYKNGVPVFLEDSTVTSSFATAIFVSGKDVYVAGQRLSKSNGKGIALYWKNGVPFPLSDSTTAATATAITVSGSDVYVAGYVATGVQTEEGDNSVAKYWKNGTAVALTNGNNPAEATGIAVSGKDVYVSGFESGVYNGFQTGTYWKNGVPVRLTDSTSSSVANAIALSTQ